MSKFYPGLNRILVKKMDLPTSSSIIAVTANQQYGYGEIIAVGSVKDSKEFKDGHFYIGDNVYYLAQAGTDIELPDGTFRLLSINEVLVGIKKEA